MENITCIAVNADNLEEEFFRYQGMPAGRGDYLHFDGFPYLVKEVEYNLWTTPDYILSDGKGSATTIIESVTLRSLRV